MAPNLDEDKRQASFPQLQYPAFRDVSPRAAVQWLEGKQLQDNAEGLWRIHDKLYDLTNFIPLHPGGPEWIELTKGTDITEAFETHHLSGVAEAMLPKYFVKTVNTPRNSPFTFKKDGFYKTLKAKAIVKLKDIPKGLSKQSHRVTELFFAGLLILSPLSCWLWTQSLILGALCTAATTYCLSSLTICGHNYLHQKDSWRMYLFNFSGFSYRDFRISHALSHHLHTNTAQDLELSMLEPMLNYMPRKDKNIWSRLGAFYYPVVFAAIFLANLVKELASGFEGLANKKLTWANAIPLTLPIWMWLVSGVYFPYTIATWIVILSVSSLIFMTLALTTGHHSHSNFFDGDIPKNTVLDWGIFQLDTVEERVENLGDHFATLTRFGHHALHHFFPTLDHAQLDYLLPLLLDHCEEYEAELKMTTYFQNFIKHSKQLLRTEANDFRKKDKSQ